MHLAAVVLLGLAGCLFCVAALVYWRRMASNAEGQDKVSMIIVGVAMSALSVSLLLSIIEQHEREFTYAVLSTWAAVGAMLFIKRFLAMPSRSLLIAPIGAVAIMVAVVSLMDPQAAATTAKESLPFVTLVHIIFMVLYLVAALVAGAAAISYFIADRQLRSATERAFKLPSLPSLRRMTFMGLVVCCAVLCAGLATGAAATTYVEAFNYVHPLVLISIIDVLVLLVLLFIEVTRGLGQKVLSIMAILILISAVCLVVSLNLQSPYA